MILKRIEKWSCELALSVLPVEDTSHISHIGKRTGVQNQPSLALPIDHLSQPKVSSAAYSFEKPSQEEAMDRGALFGHLIPKLHQKKKAAVGVATAFKRFFLHGKIDISKAIRVLKWTAQPSRERQCKVGLLLHLCSLPLNFIVSRNLREEER